MQQLGGQLEANGTLLQPMDAGGVWPLVLSVAGYSAMQRGSDLIEGLDLIKAIYVTDLEHISELWNDWEGLERFVCSMNPTVHSTTYINRTLYLVRLELAIRESPGEFIGFGKTSPLLEQVAAAARKVASERVGAPTTASSRDLLFAACLLDGGLSESLQESGLQLDKLAAAVRKT